MQKSDISHFKSNVAQKVKEPKITAKKFEQKVTTDIFR